MENKTLTLGSLFDGSGGFPLGGLLCGVTPVWASEVEPFPIRVTTKRLPFMKHYGDVSKLSGSGLEPVDIITFGSPCQDMSVAGKRSGLDGERSSLFYEAIRIVKEMRCATNGRYPRYIVWENVPGAFSSNKGEDFKAVLEAVCSVKEDKADIPRPEKWPNAGEIMADNYSVAWRVLDAQYWGVPQRRKRIFLVADFAGQCAGKILFESEGLSGYSAEGFKAWQRAARGAAPCPGAAGVCLNDQGGSCMDISEDVTGTLRAETHGHAPCVMDAAGFCTEHSAKARSIGYEEGRSPTLRAGVVPAVVPIAMNERQYAATVSEDVANTLTGTDYKGTQCVFENHSADTRYKGPLDISPTISANLGMGGNNQPFVVRNTPCYDVRFTSDGAKVARGHVYETETARTIDTGGNAPDSNQGGVAVLDMPKTMKIRSGCEGGGKGALVQEDKSATLSCNNDQTVFVPKAYGISSDQSHAMLSDNPHSGIYEAETSRTLDTGGGNPGCNQGGIAVVERHPVVGGAHDPYREETVAPTVDTNGARPTCNQVGVSVVESYALQGSMIAREDKNGPQGDGIGEDVSFTLNTVDRHAVYAMTTGSYMQTTEDQSPTLMARDFKDPTAVAYGIGRDAFNQGQNAKFKPAVEKELQPTLVAKGPGAVQNGYTVRRLTPTECARLQGFPDWWCADLGTENPTEEDMAFWRDVFETHRLVLGTSSKPKTDNQIRKWLKDPYTDAAEYKMWGNGVALPCVAFVMAGIVYYAQSDG